MTPHQQLLERLKYVVERLDEATEDFGQLPKPYDFYKAIKNDGEATGWRYECVGIGITDLREMIEYIESKEGL